MVQSTVTREGPPSVMSPNSINGSECLLFYDSVVLSDSVVSFCGLQNINTVISMTMY